MTIVSGRLGQLEEKITDEKMKLEEEKKKIEAAINDLVYKTYGYRMQKKNCRNS